MADAALAAIRAAYRAGFPGTRAAEFTPSVGEASDIVVQDFTAGAAFFRDGDRPGIAATRPTVNVLEADLAGAAPEGGTLVLAETDDLDEATWKVESSLRVNPYERTLFLVEPPA